MQEKSDLPVQQKQRSEVILPRCRQSNVNHDARIGPKKHETATDAPASTKKPAAAAGFHFWHIHEEYYSVRAISQ